MRVFIRLFFCLFVCFSIGTASATAFQSQQKVVVHGYIRDASSGESLVSANVQVVGNQRLAVLSNNFGFFSLGLPSGNVELEVSYVGYQSRRIALQLQQDTTLNVELTPSGMIEEVVITADSRINQVNTPQMGLTKVDVLEIKQIPVLFGERDVLKTIQLLPGIVSGGEGSSQFFVRGGMGDQNLILLDGATVYNASHLFGFFSTFNSDAIKDVELYKGGMPAQYGGRLASVLDISMLEGNTKKYGAEGGIGLIASRLKLEGPIVKDKGSFIVSGRRTYADLFLKLSSNPDVNQSRLYFYDLNLKANYRLNDRNSLYLSGYFGEDILGYADVFRFDWGNTTASLRWNRIWNTHLFSNTTAVFSDYNYKVDLLDPALDFEIASRIRSYNLKHDFQWYANGGNTLKFGADLRSQQLQPTNLNPGGTSGYNQLDIENRQGAELAAYLSHEWKPNEVFSMIYGLRANNFLSLGPGTFYTYDPQELDKGEPGDRAIAKAEQFANGQVAQHYLTLEPRLSMNYKLSEVSSIKGSYSRNAQFLHQLSNATSSLPTDTWVMSSNNVKPQLADQVALGYYRNFNNNQYEFSVESYYKYMDNQIEFRDGADLQANKHLEADLVYGIGRAYGLEWYLKKHSGALNGWISYSLSKSERKFDAINDGRWFNARQDRTHDFSAVLIYELSKRWNLSGTFVYSTGQAVTYPSAKYQVDGQTVWYYAERNAYRMPDYHRLDLAATYEGKPGKWFTSSWNFGLFNVYNRRNAYIIDFRESETQAEKTEIYRIALFGIIPSVTWNFKF